MLVTHHKFFSMAVTSHTCQLVGDLIPSSLQLAVTSYTLLCIVGLNVVCL